MAVAVAVRQVHLAALAVDKVVLAVAAPRTMHPARLVREMQAAAGHSGRVMMRLAVAVAIAPQAKTHLEALRVMVAWVTPIVGLELRLNMQVAVAEPIKAIVAAILALLMVLQTLVQAVLARKALAAQGLL